MKKIITVIFAFHFVVTLNAQAPDSWTEKNGMGLNVSGNSYMPRRYGAVSFGIGIKLYIGTGGMGSSPQRDFWEFDPGSNSWTQKADFGGGQRLFATAMSIGSKGYVGTGQNPAQAYQNDFWEYDPATNTWTQKANLIGFTRIGACAFSISGKGYMGTGNIGNFWVVNDFFEYDPTLNTWTQKANFAGTARYNAAGFAIGNKGYIGIGDTITQIPLGYGFKKDFWEYDPTLNTWTQKANFAGSPRAMAIGISVGNKGYIGLGQEEITFNYKSDFWEYDPAANSWLQKANFGGSARVNATGCSVGTNLYVATGYGNGYQNDMWEYNPSANSWIQKPVVTGKARYLAISFSIGTKGYTGIGYDLDPLKDFWEYNSITGSWTQKSDFGGSPRSGAVGFSIGNKGYAGLGRQTLSPLNDFWEYDPAANAWTQKANFAGVARYEAVGFSVGNKGYVGTGYGSSLRKDFWEYDPLTNNWAQKTDFGGTARNRAVGFSIGNKGYVGTGTDGTSKVDFWEYNPSANTWMQKANFTGTARNAATGFSLGNKGYIGTGYFSASSSSFDKDFFEYDPVTNTWTQRADFGGSARSLATAFIIGDKAYMGTGFDSISKSDFWEYTPVCATPVTAIYSSGNTTFCNGDSVFLYANNGYNYQWKKNGVDITGATIYFYYAKTVGSYTCYLTNSCGAATSGAIAVTVNVLPSATITPAGPTTFCSGGSVVLNAPVAANRTYQWKKGVNLISGATLSSYTATTGGNYRVIVTNTVTGCSRTTGSATVVTINALPTATITPQGPTTFCAGGSVVLAANTGAGLTYKWKKGSNFISGATLSNYTATLGGTYKVEVTNSNGCSKLSAGVIVTVPCREGKIFSENDFDVKVFPNPNSGEFTIKFSNKPSSPIQIELTDELGKVVTRFETNNETVVIKETNLANGIYCLSIRNHDEVVIKKISIAK